MNSEGWREIIFPSLHGPVCISLAKDSDVLFHMALPQPLGPALTLYWATGVVWNSVMNCQRFSFIYLFIHVGTLDSSEWHKEYFKLKISE